MIRKYKFISSLLFFSSISLSLQGAGPFSLLFSPQEVDIIREHLEGGGDIETLAPEIPFETLYLSAIMFMDAQNWTIWLNDQIIHAGDFLDFLPIQIKTVTASDVTFAWTPPGQKAQTIKLRAGQTFHPGNEGTPQERF